MANKKILTQYQAAVATGMSPELLRWLTKNPPKQDLSRVLKFEKVENEVYFYEEAEILNFNNWLKAPWPHKPGKRPHVPTAIKSEIKVEANGECAMCHKHKDTCEAAHLDPVSKSLNNHPENLLWLCSNHHTAYDKGLFGPKEEDADFVSSFKQTLYYFRRTQWLMQQELSHKLFALLQSSDSLAKQHESAKTSEQTKAIEDLAEQVLAVIPTIAPLSKTDPKYAAYQAISLEALSLATGPEPVAKRLRKAQNIRRDYIAAFGFVRCPLCRGSGRHEDTACAVCNGDREIDEHLAERVDLQAFEKVSCPLCEGAGQFRGDACPVCGGDAEMDRRYADTVDLGEYQEVDCPLCKGTGSFESDRCPACDGDARIDRRYAERIDLKEYETVDCPVCEGTGRHDGETCRVCHGDARMHRRYADQVDSAEYSKVDCPVCAGTGRYKDGDCPVCGGEKQVDRIDLERIDVRDYEHVECPICEGAGRSQGIDCRACGGEGRVERRHSQSIDPADYD
jgi:DnaJ-class molecular chaperone